MVNKEYEAVILEREESEYELTDDFAESFIGIDITSGPKTESSKSVVGIVDDCECNEEGIVAQVVIFDPLIDDLFQDDLARICPTVVRDIGSTNTVEGIDAFVTCYPADEVGEVRKVE